QRVRHSPADGGVGVLQQGPGRLLVPRRGGTDQRLPRRRAPRRHLVGQRGRQRRLHLAVPEGQARRHAADLVGHGLVVGERQERQQRLGGPGRTAPPDQPHHRRQGLDRRVVLLDLLDAVPAAALYLQVGGVLGLAEQLEDDRALGDQLLGRLF